MAGPYDIGGNWQPLSPNLAYFQILSIAPSPNPNGRSYFDTNLGLGIVVNGAWTYVSGGGGGTVASVFGRTGAITAQAGDYSSIYFPTPTGTTLQYLRGDGSTATFPTNVSSFTNDSGYLTSASNLAWAKVTGTPTTISTYGITDGVTLTGTQTLSNKTITGYQTTISLTTTGTSGAATLVSGTLNVPQYAATPAGSTGQIQYNNASAFAATSYMSYASNLVTFGGALATSNTQNLTSGFTLVNTTAAIVTAGSTQQISPPIIFSGQAWSTSSSASQTGVFIIYNQPTTGASISDTLVFASSENGGALANRMTLTSGGNLAPFSITTNSTITSGAGIVIGANSILNWSGANAPALTPADQNGTISQRNNAVQQAYRIYNSFSSGPNTEFVEIGWKKNANICTINTTNEGTGTLRSIQIAAPSITLNSAVIVRRTTVADIAYTILTTDFVVAYTSLTTARTTTLPTAVGVTGQMYVIKDEAGTALTNNITIATTASQTIDGSSTKVIITAYGSVTLYSNGANWFTK